MRTTSRDYRHPHRPWPVRALNALGASAAKHQLPALDADALASAAQRATGLTSFGPDPWRIPLEKLCDSLRAEARLNFLGRIITRARLVGVLEARLRQQAHYEEHPETLARPVPSPVVITGLQRTGTTFLHRMLSADPRLRALSSWEAIHPPPLPGDHGNRSRRARAHRAAGALAYLAPDFLAVHPVEADQPEEEVVLLEQTFLSTVSEAILHVPSYSAWLEDQDQVPAYRMLRKVLQILDHQRAGDHWVLKTPHHLEWLDALLAVFPDARIIHTHRDPVVTLPSFCSMVAHGRGLCTDHVDPAEVGRHWLRKTGRMLDRALATRDARPDLQVCDVMYDDLVRDPMATIAHIYRSLDMSFPDTVRDAIETRRASSHRHRYGKHVYELGDFDLSTAQVADRHAAYRERFGFS